MVLSEDFTNILGNISDDLKQTLNAEIAFLTQYVAQDSTIFGESIQKRLRITEVSLKQKDDEPKKPEVRAVVELDVTEDMLNAAHTLHGGCSAFLVDICSSFAIHAFQIINAEGATDHPIPVSQSLNMIYHAPASLGDRLRVINTTLTIGSRAFTARTEIWSETHHRLVASGTHVKLIPLTRSKI
jgi:acyl-coenzyme A thioesterase 13